MAQVKMPHGPPPFGALPRIVKAGAGPYGSLKFPVTVANEEYNAVIDIGLPTSLISSALWRKVKTALFPLNDNDITHRVSVRTNLNLMGNTNMSLCVKDIVLELEEAIVYDFDEPEVFLSITALSALGLIIDFQEATFGIRQVEGIKAKWTEDTTLRRNYVLGSYCVPKPIIKLPDFPPPPKPAPAMVNISYNQIHFPEMRQMPLGMAGQNTVGMNLGMGMNPGQLLGQNMIMAGPNPGMMNVPMGMNPGPPGMNMSGPNFGGMNMNSRPPGIHMNMPGQNSGIMNAPMGVHHGQMGMGVGQMPGRHIPMGAMPPPASPTYPMVREKINPNLNFFVKNNSNTVIVPIDTSPKTISNTIIVPIDNSPKTISNTIIVPIDNSQKSNNSPSQGTVKTIQPNQSEPKGKRRRRCRHRKRGLKEEKDSLKGGTSNLKVIVSETKNTNVNNVNENQIVQIVDEEEGVNNEAKNDCVDSGNKLNGNCSFCGEFGHINKNCPSIIEMPSGNKEQTNVHVNINQTVSLGENLGTCANCLSTAHSISSCDKPIVKCAFCSELGHLGKNCPSLLRTIDESSIDKSSIKDTDALTSKSVQPIAVSDYPTLIAADIENDENDSMLDTSQQDNSVIELDTIDSDSDSTSEKDIEEIDLTSEDACASDISDVQTVRKQCLSDEAALSVSQNVTNFASTEIKTLDVKAIEKGSIPDTDVSGSQIQSFRNDLVQDILVSPITSNQDIEELIKPVDNFSTTSENVSLENSDCTLLRTVGVDSVQENLVPDTVIFTKLSDQVIKENPSAAPFSDAPADAAPSLNTSRRSNRQTSKEGIIPDTTDLASQAVSDGISAITVIDEKTDEKGTGALISSADQSNVEIEPVALLSTISSSDKTESISKRKSLTQVSVKKTSGDAGKPVPAKLLISTGKPAGPKPLSKPQKEKSTGIKRSLAAVSDVSEPAAKKKVPPSGTLQKKFGNASCQVSTAKAVISAGDHEKPKVTENKTPTKTVVKKMVRKVKSADKQPQTVSNVATTEKKVIKKTVGKKSSGLVLKEAEPKSVGSQNLTVKPAVLSEGKVKKKKILDSPSSRPIRKVAKKLT